jgi:hypothetical protein
MKHSELKKQLESVDSLHFVLPSGEAIPAHFHLTEAGLSTKHFIDCGGTIRQEKNISLQLWVANDQEHRLTTSKLLNILQQSEKLWNGEDLEIEIEYHQESISRFGLSFQDGIFTLTPKHTNCLAQDNCGIKPELVIGCCTPGGGCC